MPSHVLVLATPEAPAAPSWLRRRPRPRGEDPEAAEPVWLSRATVVDVGEPLEPERAAVWLRGAGEPELEAGLAALNRALFDYRIAAADPELASLERRQAIAARVGYGAGAEVAEGRFQDVRELVLDPARRPRRRLLTPDARLAAFLTGRERPLVCEELALRARLDLASGRNRHAALQLLILLDAAIAELSRDAASEPLAERIEELRSLREPVAACAQTALAAEPSEDEATVIERALSRVEAALRARVLRPR